MYKFNKLNAFYIKVLCSRHAGYGSEKIKFPAPVKLTFYSANMGVGNKKVNNIEGKKCYGRKK